MSENVYYNPEKFGLSSVGVLDEDGLSYQFNTLIVFVHSETGRLFWAHDSGCSCPTPFESYHFSFDSVNGLVITTDLSEIHPGTFDAFEGEIRSFPCEFQEKMDLLWKVKQRLKVA